MHYMMHGQGFQTWEYSPQYAIRSYAYLWQYLAPLKFYTLLFNMTKVIQFYILRCMLALVCSLCEVYFYRAACRRFGGNTGRIVMFILMFSTGLFISSTAFLPSSYAMYMTLVSMAAWYTDDYPVAILATAASAVIGWPFAAAIGVPIAFDVVVRKRQLGTFIVWSMMSLVICLVPVIMVDSHYYGNLVVAPLNILLYNVFSQHGPNIYGVESWSFYFVNGFLNFNVAFPLALVSLPVVVFTALLIKDNTGTEARAKSKGRRLSSLPVWLSLSPMYIWILIFFTRPHKEERFLFPVYPLFCLAAAVTLDHLQKLYSWLLLSKKRQHYTDGSHWISFSTCVIFIFLSMSRTFALYKGYHAPLDVYTQLQEIANDPSVHTLPPDNLVNVCIGKEWYRFPSNFFMPTDRWQLSFIRSQFKGQLPKPYSQGVFATRKIPTHMNDANLEETSRYINISRCHYLVDLDVPRESEEEPRYSLNTKEWKVVATAKYLDNAQSPRLLRAFYVPYYSDTLCTYVDYNILKSTRTRRLNI